MKYDKLLSKIEEYDSIVIHRHKRPDMDALGCQLGLKHILEATYPHKSIYVVGNDTNDIVTEDMDIVDDLLYTDILAIIVDSGATHLIDDDRYNNAKHIMNIDHHQQQKPYGDTHHVDTSKASCCSIIIDMCIESNLIMTKKASEYLFMGLVTDSGRFLYSSVTSDTFKYVQYLLTFDIDINELYLRLYKSSLDAKRLHGYVLSHFVVDEKVAYIKFFDFDVERFNTDIGYLKSGTINLMSNIENIPIWATFTEGDGMIYVEIRGNIDVISVAKKYGGGGHNKACGAAVKDWHEVSRVIHDLNMLVK